MLVVLYTFAINCLTLIHLSSLSLPRIRNLLYSLSTMAQSTGNDTDHRALMAGEQSLSSIEDPKSTDSVADQPQRDDSLVSETEPESSDKGSKSIEPEKSKESEKLGVSMEKIKDDSPVLEKAKKTVRMQSAVENYSEVALSVKPAGILKPSPSLGTNLDSIDTSVSPGRMSSDNVFAMMDEAWERLKKSYVYFKGSPVGTLAALDPSAEDLNYNQVYI